MTVFIDPVFLSSSYFMNLIKITRRKGDKDKLLLNRKRFFKRRQFNFVDDLKRGYNVCSRKVKTITLKSSLGKNRRATYFLLTNFMKVFINSVLLPSYYFMNLIKITRREEDKDKLILNRNRFFKRRQFNFVDDLKRRYNIISRKFKTIILKSSLGRNRKAKYFLLTNFMTVFINSVFLSSSYFMNLTKITRRKGINANCFSIEIDSLRRESILLKI